MKVPRGAAFALGSAALFGASTPFAKLLRGGDAADAARGAALLGSGLGLGLCPLALIAGREAPLAQRPALARRRGPLRRRARPVAPDARAARTPAAAASLLLNLEGVFTALLAWFVFRENFDRRIALGMALIVAGGVVLSLARGRLVRHLGRGARRHRGACLCWAIDNNLTQKVSAGDPVQVAAIKGLSRAASIWPSALCAAARAADGRRRGVRRSWWACSATASAWSLFVLALRHLGTARTGAYFSLAPFVGAAVSVLLLGEPGRPPLFVAAAALMGAGVWLHLTEQHEHEHHHEPLAHEPPPRPRRAPPARARSGVIRRASRTRTGTARAADAHAPALPGHPPPAPALRGVGSRLDRRRRGLGAAVCSRPSARERPYWALLNSPRARA